MEKFRLTSPIMQAFPLPCFDFIKLFILKFLVVFPNTVAPGSAKVEFYVLVFVCVF